MMEQWQHPNTLLQAARARKGWSQEKLAEEIGVTGNTVSRWERGEMVPTAYYRTRLCEAFGMTTETLGLLVRTAEQEPPTRQAVVAWADADRKHALVAKLLRTLEVQGIPAVSPWLLGRRSLAHKKKTLDDAIRVAPFVVLILSPQARASHDVRATAELAQWYRRPLVAFWIAGEHMPDCLPIEPLSFSVTLDLRDSGEQELVSHVLHLLEQTTHGSKEQTSHLPQQNDFIAYADDVSARKEEALSLALATSDEMGSRSAYLKHMLQRYRSVTLPLGPIEGFPLQAIFQPLTLRRDPRTAEDLEREQRRVLLGEAMIQEKELPITAQTSEEALQKSPQQRIVILGGPGSGKTTTLQFLIYQQAQRSLVEPAALLPILVSLPDLARSGKTMGEYLLQLTREAGVADQFALMLSRAIEEGRAFICLDGLDEVSPPQRPEVIRVINEDAARAGNTWVVGSRFTEYKGGQFSRGQFAEWELQPMSHALRQELASRLLPELARLFHPDRTQEENAAFSFVHLLETHAQAAAWGENPLLFSLAAVMFVRLGTLPASRAVLYQHVVDAILENREKDPVRRKVVRRIIADLALQLYQTRGRTFTLDDIVWLLPRIREQHRENWVTEEMATRIIGSGLLDVVARETYGFRHQTFHEYLAAAALAQLLVSQDHETHTVGWNLAWSKRTYSRWTEILRLMVGVLIHNHRREGARQAQQWLDALLLQGREGQGDPGHLGLTLALRSLAELTETKTSFWKDVQGEKTSVAIIQRWGETLREEAEPNLVTLTSLDERSKQIVINNLLQLIHDQDWRVRERAIRALGMLDGHMLKEVMIAISHDTSASVRRAGAALLGKLGEDLTTECLLNFLSDEEESIRFVVEHTLVNQAKQTFVRHLLLHLQDENWRVRAAKASILAQWGEKVSVEPFLKELQAEEWRRRLAALMVLDHLHERVPLEPLVAALRDKEFNIRVIAASILSNQAQRVSEEMIALLSQDKDPQVRAAAMQIWASRDAQTFIKAISQGLHDKHGYVRAQIVRTLAQLGAQIPVELLLAALQDEYDAVRISAATALEKRSGRVPLEPLIAAVQDDWSYVRASSLRAVWQQGECALVETLLTPSAEHFEWMRVIAIGLLGKLGDIAPVEPVLEALGDSNANVRAAAAWALRKRGKHAPIEPLLAALQDDHHRVRWAAVNTMQYMGEQAPVEAVKAASLDENEDVRNAAQHTLFYLRKHPSPRSVSFSGSGSSYEDWPTRWVMKESNYLRKDVPARQAQTEEGQLDNHSSIEELLSVLHRDNGKRRKDAMEILEARVKQGIVEPLVQLIGKQAPFVRTMIVKILGQSGPSMPIELFLSLSQTDEDGNVRMAAAQVLGQLGEQAPVAQLVAAFQDENIGVRAAAAQTLGQLGELAPIDMLVAALEDQEAYLRGAIINALTHCGVRVPSAVFLPYLGDSDAGVRHAATEALQRTYPDVLPKVIPEIIAIIRRQKMGPILGSIAQTFIAETIGRLQSPSPALLEQLTSLLDWPHWETQLKAIQALGQIRRSISDAAIRRLLELRLDPQSPLIRSAADKALAEILSLETGIEDDEALG